VNIAMMPKTRTSPPINASLIELPGSYK
jgi:hypothetical protein